MNKFTELHSMQAGSYIICDGTNNPEPGTRPYAVLYRMAYKLIVRGSLELADKFEYYDGLAFYLGGGRWADYNNGSPAGCIPSESPDVVYDDSVDYGEVEEFCESIDKNSYAVKSKYTVYAYIPLPELPDGFVTMLEGGLPDSR